jgi:hypothetical protein
VDRKARRLSAEECRGRGIFRKRFGGPFSLNGKSVSAAPVACRFAEATDRPSPYAMLISRALPPLRRANFRIGRLPKETFLIKRPAGARAAPALWRKSKELHSTAHVAAMLPSESGPCPPEVHGAKDGESCMAR